MTFLQRLGFNPPAPPSPPAELMSKGTAVLSIDDLIGRLERSARTLSGITVTPENCMESPTVHGIVTVMTRTMASLSVDVMQRTTKNGRTTKEQLPNHPVAKLLAKPNEWQTKTEYWLDATSFLLRYGQSISFKGRGQTGPIRRLVPLIPRDVDILQDENRVVTFRILEGNGQQKEYPISAVHYARGPARDGLRGDSPVWDCREAIAAEIAAQRFGGAFFGNGAMPGLILKFAEGFSGFRTEEDRAQFVRDFQQRYSGSERFSAALLPKGVEIGQTLGVEPDKAQFTQTRELLRNIICGAWGIPPYVAGDLSRQTFNNAEQQSINKSMEVTVPIAKIFESAMEKDLLTDEDRRDGIIIRFNVDAALRGDFKSRQEGLKIMRDEGVINANEWRNMENMNPREDVEGETYWDGGTSGQNSQPGQPKKPAAAQGEDDGDTAN